MKVYAITAGEYSDYHIVAITDDKEKAEAMADLINKKGKYGYGDAQVEEYDTKDVDISIGHPNRKYFRVHASAQNNWIIRCYEIDLDDYLQVKNESCYFICKSNKLNDYWYFYCSARGQDQAIKKATDWLAQEKAKKEGVV